MFNGKPPCFSWVNQVSMGHFSLAMLITRGYIVWLGFSHYWIFLLARLCVLRWRFGCGAVLAGGLTSFQSSLKIYTFSTLCNSFPLLLNPTQILKTRVLLQFWKICGWPIWLLIDWFPLKSKLKTELLFVGFPPQ